MKKLILLITILFSLNSFGQKATLNYEINVADVTTDTLIQISLEDCVWRLQEVNTGLTGTIDGQLNIYESADRLNWDKIDNSAVPYTIQKDTSKTFINNYFPPGYLGIKFIKNNLTGGTIKYIFNYELK